LDKSVSSCAHVSKILSSTGIAHGRTKQKSLKLNNPHHLHNTPHASSGHLGLQLSHLQSPAYTHLSISFHRATLAQTPTREAGKQRVSNVRIEAVTNSAEASTEGNCRHQDAELWPHLTCHAHPKTTTEFSTVPYTSSFREYNSHL
jgi:hypothetical protein